jgi:hypothetical protein
MKYWAMLFLMILSSFAYAAEPNAQERAFFDELKNRFELHKDLAPVSADTSIGTLSKEYELTFACPNPPPTQGRIKISTKLVAWNGGEESGKYEWICSQEVSQKEKLLDCQNEISIDISKMLPENNLAKQADNVRIYYHEWLHAQLLIDAMQTKDWQTKFCSCNTDFAPADLEDPHRIIPKYDIPFMVNLTDRIVNMEKPWVPEFGEVGLVVLLATSIFTISIMRKRG